MKYTPRRILRALYRRFVTLPRGGGHPVPKEAFDREYSSGRWVHHSSFEELPRYLVLAGFVHHFYLTPAILDVGCGEGRLATLHAPRPFESYLGIDISTEAVARARALGLARVEFLEADFEKWSPDRSYDAIVFNECLGYAEDPGRIIGRFAPSLRAGGRFFVSMYRFGNWAAIWRRIGKCAVVEAATSVASANGKTWDIKVLQPLGRPPG